MELKSVEGAEAVESELKRLEDNGAELAGIPGQGSGANIDILDGGISVGQFQNDDGTYTPTLVVNIAFAIRLGKDGAITMAEALAEVAGKKVIIKPTMALPGKLHG